MQMRQDSDEAFAMALGPAGEIIRLAPYARERGVWAPCSVWFVTASVPG